ncbi:MAG: endonuclease/exonuclease/phosphatase family protein [Bdellovibrionota bacterium]
MKSFFVILIFKLILITASISEANLPLQFTVGSYNLYGLRNENDLKKDLNSLSNVQIWAFQEVEGNFSEKTEQKLKNILPSGEWYIFSQKVNLLDQKKGVWEGQVIASRFPILSVEVIPLNHSGQKKRVALVANFKTENGENFFFANTDHEVQIFSIDFNDRKKQLLSLVEYFNKTESMGVIAGDFNTTGGDEEISNTEEIMDQAQLKRATSSGQNTCTFEKMFIKNELDHFFSRGVDFSARHRFDGRKGSDHYPIYMDINLL